MALAPTRCGLGQIGPQEDGGHSHALAAAEEPMDGVDREWDQEARQRDGR